MSLIGFSFEDGCWRFWLVGPNGKPVEKAHDARGKDCVRFLQVSEPFLAAITERPVETELILTENAMRIADGLDWHDQQFYDDVLVHENATGGAKPTKRERAWFRRSFSDGVLMLGDEAHRLVSLKEGSPNVPSLEKWLAASILFKGLYLYLSEGDRYISLEARLALLFSAWQWYNALKRVTAESELIQNLPTKARHHLSRELSRAYWALIDLLEDERFSQPAHWLSLMEHGTTKSRALARDNLRRSMVLIEDTAAAKTEDSIALPLPAPGCLGEDVVHWSRVKLHPLFGVGKIGQGAVQRLVQEWVLPRYDYGTAIRMARLMKNNRPSGISPYRELWGIPALVLIIGLFSWLGLCDRSPWFYVAVLLEWIILLAIVITGVKRLYWRLLPDLALPRLLGGMGIGYLALVIESNDVAIALWGWGVTGLWLAVLSLGFGYLFFEARAIVLNNRIAAGRAAAVMGLAVVSSLIIGLFAVWLSTEAYGSCNGCEPYLLGPVGCLSLCKYAAYTPLALIVGLATQFIWEERTVTSPVWTPEER